MRNFSARETEWLQELDGIELASFQQRAFAIVIDGVLVGIILSIVASAVLTLMLHSRMKVAGVSHVKDYVTYLEKTADNHEAKIENIGENSELLKIFNDVAVPILYFGILLWKGKGQTPGKRIMKIRVVSLMHRHITFWHSVERALGYGAAALEGGFGFVQFFIHPYRRCAQDRLAETIVVTERSYQEFQHKISHPLLPDTPANEHAPE